MKNLQEGKVALAKSFQELLLFQCQIFSNLFWNGLENSSNITGLKNERKYCSVFQLGFESYYKLITGTEIGTVVEYALGASCSKVIPLEGKKTPSLEVADLFLIQN